MVKETPQLENMIGFERTRKSGPRTMIVKGIMDFLKSDQIKTLDYRNTKETRIKTFLQPHFVMTLQNIHRTLSPGQRDATLARKGKNSLLWESDVNTTINNVQFLGVQHRPDFVVQIESIRIAVEVKRGDSGSSVREGLGQSLVYASEFDFVCFLFIDQSKDKKVLRSLAQPAEISFIQSLWATYNIQFEVV